MKIPKPKMPTVTSDHVEIAGFLCLVVGAVLVGLWVSGAVAAGALGFLVAGALLVIAGNATGGDA